MRQQLRIALLVTAAAFLLAAIPGSAQVDPSSPARRLITQAVDARNFVTLAGNTRPEANAANDLGRVQDSFMLEHVQLQMQFSAEKKLQLDQLIEDLHNPASPNYHKWLTADEFRRDFSPAPEDVETVTAWLASQGFSINVTYPGSIDFSGTAAQILAAFRTEIHNFNVNGVRHFANFSDPQIPAAFAPAVAGIVSLNDFMPHPENIPRTDYTVADGYYVVPGDLATIYNFNPVFAKGTSGQGQTIVVVEDTDVFSTTDWSTFRSTLGLSGYTAGSFTQIHPAPPSGTNNCSDPGVNTDDGEAIIDAEWSTAAAPSAAIVLASCTDTTNFGGFIALQNLLNESGTPPAIVSISYGASEPELGASANSYISALYEQAAAEGVSIFVSSGDEGAASSDADASYATHGVTVSGYTSTPYNVSVGGTDFGDTFSGSNNIYWNSTNTSTYASAKSYVPEIPWNDSCASELLSSYLGYSATYGTAGFCNSTTGKKSYLTTASGSGGPSGCAAGIPSTSGVVSGTCAGYAKPSWQSVLGNPSDGVRDVPDVALFAANGVWGHYYVVCYSDTARGGHACSGAPSTWSGFGGTSVSSPIMAGVQSLINQVTGSRAGNPNATYYSLAAAEYGASGNSSCNSTLGDAAASTCVFYDITQGDMDVTCKGTTGCYLPSGTYGALSLSDSAYRPSYGTTTGWDFATGIGSVNVYNLLSNWPIPPSITSTASATFVVGTPGTFMVTDTGTPTPTLSESGSLPSGLTFNAAAATLSGTPAASTGGVYNITITASNGVGTNATQNFVLTVDQAPAIGSANGTSFTTGSACTFTVTATGFPAPAIAESGTLPGGVTFNATTGILSGTPANGSSGTYIVSFTASNGVGANAIQSFTLSVSAPAGSGTWSNGYTYQRAVTISSTEVPNTNQSNFPVLISGTYSYLATLGNGGNVTNSNGYDILFTADSAGTTPLAFERESYNPATGAVTFWVKLPTLSHTSNTVFYMFYGNSSVSTDPSSKSAVWDSNYVGVWHLSDDAANTSVQDSTANGNNGTASTASNSLSVSGEIARALSFNGSDAVTTGLQKTTASTWEAWFYNTLNGSYQSILTIDGANYLLMDLSGSNGSFWSADGMGGTNLGVGGLSQNTWYHLVLVRSGDNSSTGYTAYLNGVLTGQASSGSLGSGNTVTFGYRPDLPQQAWNGNLDEVRVSNTARSSDWIATEYNNQSSPSSFYSLGMAQTAGAGSAPVITALSPSAGTSGTVVTIAGTAFGSTKGTSTVTFNGTAGTPTNWSATSITAPVPAGASTGNVVVTVAGQASNGVPFTVSPTGSAFSYERAITINHTLVPNTDQSNFAVLISGTYPYLATVGNGGNVSNPNGYDVLFTADSAGTIPLAFERESYNPATGAVTFWVKLPTLSHSANTVFYMFYDNSSISTDPSSKSAVWDSNYVGVWHLSDDAANTSVLDSTANGNNGTASTASNSLSVSGEIARALSFNGSDAVTTGLQKTTASTWEAWFYNTLNGSYQSILTIDGANYLLMDLSGSNGSFWSADGMGGTNLGVGGLSQNTWYHLVLVRSGDNSSTGYTAYLNGVLTGQASSGSLGSGNTITFGYRPNLPQQAWNGNLDEVRVSNTARSSDWIATEYNNQSSPSNFYSVGPTQ